MIIDCHGHYTTAPAAHTAWREAQQAAFRAGERPPPYPTISDDEIRASIEGSQLRLMAERGVDLTIFSPRASAMGHHVGDEAVSAAWARACNDLIARVVPLYPGRFAGVCQLPQSPGVPDRRRRRRAAPLRRGARVRRAATSTPTPAAATGPSPPLTDRSWYPLYEAMVELDVPAMVHVSAVTNPNFHATGSHYLNADTTAFMQLLQADLFTDFPGLRLVIPHGGGAVPYHWGRFRGLADMLGRPPLERIVLGNVFFDTCVYHQPGIDLLLRRHRHRQHPVRLGDGRRRARHRPADRPPLRRHPPLRRRARRWTPSDRHKVYEGNARRVYPRLPRTRVSV